MAIKSETVVFHISEISKQFFLIKEGSLYGILVVHIIRSLIEEEQITASFPEDRSVLNKKR